MILRSLIEGVLGCLVLHFAPAFEGEGVAELVVSDADTVRLIRPQAHIARAATAVTAFVGRALKGPVNRPVSIASFDDYQRIFGGLWQPSMLSYAIEQFFENGGREAIVVRVCNGGRAPTLRLPAGTGALTLIGLSPGTREFLRASVDYDGLPPTETDRFNLVLQRVRAPGSEFIEDQEIFRRISIRADADRCVVDVLAESRLVRVLGELPPQRPKRSAAAPPAAAVGYVMSNADGDDGDTLSNYDLIGDAQSGTGLFALRGADPFNFLCVPALSRELDTGLSTLLVALRVCREHQAMLVLDPPREWTEPESAIEALRTWPFYSEDAVMFYPRVLAFDRLRGRFDIFGSAAAAAAQLARADQNSPVWAANDGEEVLLRPGLRPAGTVTELDRVRLLQAGVNLLLPVRGPGRPPAALRTRVPEAGVKNDWRFLSARRFALFVCASIERGTRWVSFEHSSGQLWARARSQVLSFFESLANDGAFAGQDPQKNYFVICDERLNDSQHAAAGQFQLLFGFAARRPGDFQTFLVSHGPSGNSVRTASVNRYAVIPRS